MLRYLQFTSHLYCRFIGESINCCSHNLMSNVSIYVCRLCGMITWMYQDKERSRQMKLLLIPEIHTSLKNYWGRLVSIAIYNYLCTCIIKKYQFLFSHIRRESLYVLITKKITIILSSWLFPHSSLEMSWNQLVKCFIVKLLTSTAHDFCWTIFFVVLSQLIHPKPTAMSQDQSWC